MSGIINEELNVKNIIIQKNENSLVTYDAKANFKVLGKQLGKDMKEVASIIQDLNSDTIDAILKGATHVITYSKGNIDISIDDIIISRNEMANKKIINDGELTVGFDTEITHDLYLEGIARDIVRGVQNLRKESNYDVSDRINLYVVGSDDISESVKIFGDYIAKETLAQSFLDSPPSVLVEIPVGETMSHIAIEKAE